MYKKLLAMIKLCFLLLPLSCAHSIDCSRPESAAALRGVVMECTSSIEDGKRYRSCLVLKASGQTINLVYRSCPL